MLQKLKPFLNIGPGRFIKEELEVRNWRQEDLAAVLGMSLKHINELIKNKKSITVEMAKLLSSAFGQSPQYWLNLDNNYRLRLKEDDAKAAEVETKAAIFKYMPIKDMIKKKWIREPNSSYDLATEVKRFWGISKIDFSFLDRVELPNFRKSEAYHHYNKYYALTWFEMAKKCASHFSVDKYQKDLLVKLAENLACYSLKTDGPRVFIENLNKIGVKFFVLSHLQKTYIDGASFLDEKNPVIVYSQRYDRLDNFWFTTAHEMSHIILHLKKRDDFFLDNLDEAGNESEIEANDYSSKMIKAEEILKYFSSFGKYVSQRRVRDCAANLGINPSLVVGVLQHSGKLSRRSLNRLKEKISDKIPIDYYVDNLLNG